LMVGSNTTTFETPFTVSVDLIGHGCTTGISAHDRFKTIRALVDPETKPEELGKPGHIFPLKAKRGGVLRRAGHTEATIDFARLAGFKPAGVLVEIMNDDGSMARLPDLVRVAERFNLKLVSIKDLIEYRLLRESLISREIEVDMPTKHGHFNLVAFKQINTQEIHMALVKGTWKKEDPVLVRVHSSCTTGDILGSCRCECGLQLRRAMEIVEEEGKGVVLYMTQDGRGIGLLDKLKVYNLREKGLVTAGSNVQIDSDMDERDYGVGAQILRALGITKMRLMTNNPRRRVGLTGYGLEVVDVVPIEIRKFKQGMST
jgi:3,4-dihydroxy 2-butanone 4-phosphate synthase / GTP cyclohydrolase II